jgi:hypothetical protein
VIAATWLLYAWVGPVGLPGFMRAHQVCQGGEAACHAYAGCAFCCAEAVAPRDVEGYYTGWGIHVDQDVLWPPGFDQDYTMGLQFEWRGSVGLINSPFWSTERQPIPMTEAVRADLSPRERLSELYVFASGGGTLWGYNALLQGQFRDSDVRLSFEDTRRRRTAPLRRTSWEFRAGVTARFRRLSLTYSLAGHTPLFDGRFRRKHVWGALAVAVTR